MIVGCTLTILTVYYKFSIKKQDEQSRKNKGMMEALDISSALDQNQLALKDSLDNIYSTKPITEDRRILPR